MTTQTIEVEREGIEFFLRLDKSLQNMSDRKLAALEKRVSGLGRSAIQNARESKGKARRIRIFSNHGTTLPTMKPKEVVEIVEKMNYWDWKEFLMFQRVFTLDLTGIYDALEITPPKHSHGKQEILIQSSNLCCLRSFGCLILFSLRVFGNSRAVVAKYLPMN